MAARSPQRWFAFLRAINVGKRRVAMERLASIFHDLDLERAETFIASGNVVFETKPVDEAKLVRRIEQALATGLGFHSDTFLRTRPQLAEILTTRPFGASPDGVVYVGFLADEPSSAASKAIAALSGDSDQFAVVGREIYWLAREGMGQSTMSGAKLEKTLGMPTTFRNVNTLERLLLKYP